MLLTLLGTLAFAKEPCDGVRFTNDPFNGRSASVSIQPQMVTSPFRVRLDTTPAGSALIISHLTKTVVSTVVAAGTPVGFAMADGTIVSVPIATDAVPITKVVNTLTVTNGTASASSGASTEVAFVIPLDEATLQLLATQDLVAVRLPTAAGAVDWTPARSTVRLLRKTATCYAAQG